VDAEYKSIINKEQGESKNMLWANWIGTDLSLANQQAKCGLYLLKRIVKFLKDLMALQTRTASDLNDITSPLANNGIGNRFQIVWNTIHENQQFRSQSMACYVQAVKEQVLRPLQYVYTQLQASYKNVCVGQAELEKKINKSTDLIRKELAKVRKSIDIACTLQLGPQNKKTAKSMRKYNALFREHLSLHQERLKTDIPRIVNQFQELERRRMRNQKTHLVMWMELLSSSTLPSLNMHRDVLESIKQLEVEEDMSDWVKSKTQEGVTNISDFSEFHLMEDPGAMERGQLKSKKKVPINPSAKDDIKSPMSDLNLDQSSES